MPTKTKTRTAEEIAADVAKDPRFRTLQREMTAERATIDENERTVELSFASESPVERWFGQEILDITTQAIDLTRLNNNGAVLVNHNWDDQVGAVVSTKIDTASKKARAVVKFSRSQRGEDIFRDIADGIRSLVSVGYIVRKMVLESEDEGVESYRVQEWTPFEISIVAVPADVSVGVGRSQPIPTEKQPAALPANPVRTMDPVTPPAAPVVVAAPGAIDLSAERKRLADLNGAADTLSQRHPQHREAFLALARKCGETGDSVDVFNRSVLADILKTDKTVAPVTRDANASGIGMNGKEIKRYSLLRAINLIANGLPLDGLEGEAHQEVTRKVERQAKGFFVPEDILAHRRALYMQQARTLLATTAPDGGYTVPTDILVSEFVELLRNVAHVVALGGRYISGLQGDISIPRQLTGTIAQWVSEIGALSDSSPTFGQIIGKPRRIGTSVPYSRQFLAQSSLDVESFVVNDSDLSIAVELDRVAINGSGGVQPLGILNLLAADRSPNVTFGGAPTWAKYVEFWSSLATNNAYLGDPAYLTTPLSAAKAMITPKFTNTGFPIWDGDRIGINRARATNQFPSTPVANQVIFGDFSQVLFLEWAGRDVIVDPYSRKKEGVIEVCIQRLIDVVIRRAKSFAVSSDSGAQ